MNVRNLGLVVAGVALLLVYMSTFTIREGQTGIRFQFGEIVQSDYKPGLHFKWPLINSVRKFDARVQTLDMEPERFLTVEKKNLLVDSFSKWRIGNAEKFYTSVGGNVFQANQRLDQIIKNGLRGEFSKRTLKEVVSGDRNQIMQILTQTAKDEAKRFGIDVLDVRIKRIDLPNEVSESVYARMRAERERVARDFRSRGQEAAERIRADADRQRTVTLAEAYRDAEITRGDGDAKAANIYAKAYGKDPAFFRFYRSLNAYRKSFAGSDNILVLQPDNSAFFKYFNSLNPSEPKTQGAESPAATPANKPPAAGLTSGIIKLPAKAPAPKPQTAEPPPNKTAPPSSPQPAQATPPQ